MTTTEPNTLHIWVDADACPRVIKDIVFRAAERRGVSTTLVANRMLSLPASSFVRAVQVEAGADIADSYIVQHLNAGDLVITADVPLAARVIEAGAHALNPRGDAYTVNSIREQLSLRNFMDELRGSGVNTGGPAAFSQQDRQNFANQLDRFLARRAPR